MFHNLCNRFTERLVPHLRRNQLKGAPGGDDKALEAVLPGHSIVAGKFCHPLHVLSAAPLKRHIVESVQQHEGLSALPLLRSFIPAQKLLQKSLNISGRRVFHHGGQHLL